MFMYQLYPKKDDMLRQKQDVAAAQSWVQTLRFWTTDAPKSKS